MDKSDLVSLEEFSTEIKRNDSNIDIEWGARISKHSSIVIAYHFELSPDGKIVKIKKSDYWMDFWD